ncbi:MAG: hypothetical protein HYT81_08900 [Gemmatimonadetes bacterium]|nr:hypothetical protein [Gemmatimonadota bacterium]
MTEIIKIAWHRDAQEAAAFQMAVADAEAARRLFDKLLAVLRAEMAGAGGGPAEGGVR